MQALEIDSTLPLPLFGTAQLMANQAGGVDRALQHLEKALDKVSWRPMAQIIVELASASIRAVCLSIFKLCTLKPSSNALRAPARAL